MFTIFAALVEGNGSVVFLWILGISVLWMFYMITFRTDDWLRLLKDEQERKANRQERMGKVAKGAFDVAKWWLNK